MKTTLELKEVLKFYVSGQEITLALQNVSVKFESGEFVAITGESGSGKSTLAHVLAGVFPCDQGVLYVNGTSMEQCVEKEWEEYRREYISFVSQNYGILPGNTVLENVVSGLLLTGMSKKEARKRAEYLLQQVDLWKLRHRKAGKLSSGQKQRLSVARAVAKPAPILIADEPTGNLDWGTASKIVKLFQEASKERLVIMVTHNFQQVEDAVNRHIVMRDGEIVEDTACTKTMVHTAQENAENKKKKEKFIRNGRHVAGLQMRARPVWTFLMLLATVVSAFAVFAFLGSFFVALDDTNTRVYSTGAYLNGIDTRLVVVKEEGSYLTEEDYEKFLTVPWVSRVERYGLLADINYYYQEGVDHTFKISSKGGGRESNIEYFWEVVLGDSSAFLQTVPVMREGEEFLKAGRLPKHMNEVVATGSVKQVGTTVDVYFQDRNKWAVDVWHKETMTIVGVTDIGEGLYFDDRIGISFWQATERQKLLDEIFSGVPMYYFVNENAEPENSAIYAPREDGTFELVQPSYMLYTADFADKEYLTYRNLDGIVNMNTGELVAGLSKRVATGKETNLFGYLGISESKFDEAAFTEYDNQATLFLTDYAYAERAMEALENMGYHAVSPYKIGSRIQDNALAKQRMSTLILCLMALYITLFAQVMVLSAMFLTQMGNFTQLRNIGLSYRTGRLALWCQVLRMTVAGQLLATLLIWLCVRLGVEYVTNLVKYLTPVHMVGLSLTHLAGTLLVAVAISVLLRTRVFPFAKKDKEVDLGELEEEGSNP